ncbi:PfkB family carbohydrate kinase [Prosthecomicrobium pneumaticum]|uniref:Ribokinase n=1 Tax=Prosthecomicrobium pneumaticum TaxID=81895 RepID=A0A7W9FMU8_9HYPH|nr:ribokinase [Prosthecomicrobium pneumaticum]
MITVFGSINIDLVCRVEALPRPGETVKGSDYRLIPGGKGANQALAARRAGAAVRMVGAVGRDDMAAAALAELSAAGVDLSAVATEGTTSGMAIITVDRHGENTIVIAPGSNARLTAAALPEGAFAPGDTLMLQMEVPWAEAEAVARRAKAEGARVMLSIAPFTPLDRDAFAAVDMILVNEGEADALARHHAIPEAGLETRIRALAAELDRTLVVTRGAEGALAATADGGFWSLPSMPVTPVDTTGAGDTFAGVLAALLDEGADLAAALRHAVVAGALACTKEGAQPSFPQRAEIEIALAGIAPAS